MVGLVAVRPGYGPVIALNLTVNGEAVSAEIEPATLLVDFLRERLGLTGTHVGCDTSQCGCCVVHVDGTARPQLIRKEQNASYYRILEAFHRRTGLPGFINTSFNMHEEPIVCSATDCVRAFLASGIDYLAIGDLLVKHPAGVAHPVKPGSC